MDCARFEEKIGELIAEQLSLPVRQEAQNHAAHCPDCRALLEIAVGMRNLLPISDQADLARDILLQTSGSACERVHRHLCQFVDGALDPTYTAMIGSHLHHCQSCSTLAGCLAELRQLLPDLAELNPGPNMVGAIVRVTSARRGPLRQWPKQRPVVRQFLNRLLWRPRFSLEAAYAGALLIFILVGNPASSLGNAYSAVWEKARVTPRATWNAARQAVPREWADFSSATFERARLRTSELIGYKERVPITLARLEQKKGSWMDDIASLPTVISSTFRSTWSKIVHEVDNWLNPPATL